MYASKFPSLTYFQESRETLLSWGVMQDTQLEIISDTVFTIITAVDLYNATDVHVVPRPGPSNGRGDSRMFFRHAGKLQLAQNWAGLTDADGVLIDGLSLEKLKEAVFRTAKPSPPVKVIRTGKRQIRARLLHSRYSERLILRFQPRTPPPISEAFKGTPMLIESLRRATGLIVICGPQGAGKSTLASSLVELWANDRRHIATIEDPVEYLIEPAFGIVTPVEASFHKADVDGLTPLDNALREVQCADVDGLFIGEIRTGRDMLRTLNVCGASEPVVITLHARSILDALLRMLNLINEHMDEETARRTLSQCIDTILYVDLAYTKEGKPVPVVLSAPFTTNSIRKNIAEGARANMLQALTTAFEGGMLPGTIRREAAIDNAKRAGATDASITAALPPGV